MRKRVTGSRSDVVTDDLVVHRLLYVHRVSDGLPIADVADFDGCVDQIDAQGNRSRFDPGRECQLLLWLYTLKDHYPTTRIHLEEVAPDGQIRQQKTFVSSFVIELFDPEGWTLQRGLFHPVATDSRYRVSVENPDVTEGALRVNKLLLLPTSDSLFLQNGGALV